MPTARGWGLAAGTAGLYVAAWLLGYPALAVLATGGAGALLLGRLVLLRRTPLVVRREIAPARVPRGDRALGVVTVTPDGRRGSRPVVASDRCGGDEARVEIPRLAPGAVHTATYFLPTRRRGEIPVGPLRVSAADPLGLWRTVREHGGAATLLVRPRTADLTAVPSGRAAHVEGPTSDTAPSGTVTFHALREYVLGDDLRHIHWRTSARSGRLMVRQLVDSSLPRTTVLLDTRPGPYGRDEDFELAVDIAASVALAAVRSGFPVTVLSPDGPLYTTAGGRAATTALLDQLALVTPATTADLTPTIDALRPGQERGSLTFVTGSPTAPELHRLAATTPRFDRTILIRTATFGPLPPTLPVTTIDAAALPDFTASWHHEVDR